MQPIQIGKANLTDIVKCLEAVNEYGKSPNKFQNKIITNKVRTKCCRPGVFVSPSDLIISFLRVERIREKKLFIFEDSKKYKEEKKNKNLAALCQFNEIPKIEDTGSKLENNEGKQGFTWSKIYIT